MSRRIVVALPLAGVLFLSLLGAHCSEPKPQGPLGTKPSTEEAAPAGEALPNEGLTEEEARRLMPGVDTSTLTPRQRSDLNELVSDTFCPCSSMTVAACLRQQPQCKPAQRFAELAKRLLAAGQSQAATLLRVEAYYGSFPNDRRREVQPDGPSKGNPEAKVALVEFSDLECPACKAAHPALGELAKKYPNDVRVVFRHFPLPRHEHAANAAAASVFAHEKGKFWEFIDLAFENQDKLDRDGLARIAKQLGLDADAMSKAVESDPKYKAKVQEDLAAGEKAGINATPTVYVNGRQLVLPPTLEYLSWTVEDELMWLANGGTWAVR